jgi:hypothetical protein
MRKWIGKQLYFRKNYYMSWNIFVHLETFWYPPPPPETKCSQRHWVYIFLKQARGYCMHVFLVTVIYHYLLEGNSRMAIGHVCGGVYSPENVWNLKPGNDISCILSIQICSILVYEVKEGKTHQKYNNY